MDTTSARLRRSTCDEELVSECTPSKGAKRILSLKVRGGGSHANPARLREPQTSGCSSLGTLDCHCARVDLGPAATACPAAARPGPDARSVGRPGGAHRSD